MGGTGGWIVSGVVFWLMALGGLVPAVLMAAGWLRRGGAPEPAVAIGPPLVRAAAHPVPATPRPQATVPTRIVVPPRQWEEPPK